MQGGILHQIYFHRNSCQCKGSSYIVDAKPGRNEMKAELFPPRTLALFYKPLGEVIYVVKEIHGVPYFKMTSYEDINVLHCTKDSIDSLKETSLVEYEHFDDSLNSTVDSLEVHNAIFLKRLNDSDKLTSVSERSFSDICDEFSVFLTEDDDILKAGSNPTKVVTVPENNENDVTENRYNHELKNDNLPKNNLKIDQSNSSLCKSHDASYKVVGSNSDLFDIEKDINDFTDDKTHEHQFKFHDIESEFFETDNETTDNEKKYFQDVESDFFDDDDLSSPGKSCSTPKKITKNEKSLNLIKANRFKSFEETKKDRATTLSNSLLRSTINELEKALNDSNVLLAKRDLRIQELRQQNVTLQKELSETLESTSQLKLLLLEKEAVLSENEKTLTILRQKMDKLSKENKELRLYKLNNLPNQDSVNVSADSSYHSSDENIIVSSPTDTKPTKCSRKKKQSESHLTLDDISENNKKCRVKNVDVTLDNHSELSDSKKQVTNNCKKKCIRKQHSAPVINACPNKVNRKTDSTSSDEKLSSENESHAHLRMKFMRDAFFYYMIGFHPDEQINAILAILDYGDKRQDFVLEAHKLKKHGKKMNITRVSTRSLTENIERKNLTS